MTNPTFTSLLNEPIKFNILAKALPSKGNMAWEYNPLKNYRLNSNKYLYRNKFYTNTELEKKFGFTLSDKNWIDISTNSEKDFNETYTDELGNSLTDTEPILFEKGQLVDFETEELNFDIHNPVDILPQYSYDNSVNLILNDGKNTPRLINSRFSAIGRNKYEIVDRKGDNDTNIYDEGDQFDIDTSLYKRTTKIPKLHFDGVYNGGNLPVGNYHFYFKYADADGNETDWIAESGLVSIFIGTIPTSINSGFENQNSKKLVKFRLTNIDSAYTYVKVYYSKESSGVSLESSTTVYKISEKFLIDLSNTCSITISGFVNDETVTEDDINARYELVSSVISQTLCKNMLFLANVKKPDIPYLELTDLSLRFLPYRKTIDYNIKIDSQYNITGYNNGYYDPDYIYNFTGYWNEDIYRLGIVYILPDNSLTPVFNIRGGYKLKEYTNCQYRHFDLYDEKNTSERVYITSTEDDYSITGGTYTGSEEKLSYENSKGVITLDSITSSDSNNDNFKVYGIEIRTTKEIITELKKYVNGFFFVRQKRMPTTLCLAITIGTDKINNTPTIPVGTISRDKNTNTASTSLFEGSLTGCSYTQAYDHDFYTLKYIYKSSFGSFLKLAAGAALLGDAGASSTLLTAAGVTKSKLVKSENPYYDKDPNYAKNLQVGEYFIEEGFLGGESRSITNNFFDRAKLVRKNYININAGLCPEAEVDQEYFGNLFTGDDFKTEKSDMLPSKLYFDWNIEEERGFYIGEYNHLDNFRSYNSKILYIPDSSKEMAIGKNVYCGVAGNAVDGWRFKYIGKENKVTKASNLLRGQFGPFIGLTGVNNPATQVDIKIPGFSRSNMHEYFKIRYNDNSPFYSISDRFSLDDFKLSDNLSIQEITTCYRGDCYICQFTHRMNRNFQDPAAPTNDDIVDNNCWSNNYTVNDGVIDKSKFTSINTGDLNAVKLGIWVTFTVRSTKNLCIRGIDESHSDEKALVGHGRGFYPYYKQHLDGSYKIPESNTFNKGFQKDFGVRREVEVADVPYIKNEFSNRILFSNPAVTDSFINNFRVFEADHFKDYTKEYGSITDIVENNGNLICIFEHGVAEIPINEKALLTNAQGDDVYIGSSEVLGEPRIISDKFGSLWKESIIKTPYYIYGVDTVAKKIWRVASGSENLQCISDVHIQQFLNLNITLSERELEPVVGIRNVKTHYNAFKQDVMFTFYDNLYGFEEKAWNLCWNEITQVWTTQYSWIPSYSGNIYNQYFSFDRNTSKWISKLGSCLKGSQFADGIVLSNNIISDSDNDGEIHLVGGLSLVNRNTDDYYIKYTLERDNFGNWKYFAIDDGSGGNLEQEDESALITQNDLKSSLLIGDHQYDFGLFLKKQIPTTAQKVLLLNISATVYKSEQNVGELDLMDDNLVYDGYYSNVIAVVLKSNFDSLTTDFWKHGQSGIINIKDKIKPCLWYGKQHPFEFEFCVNEYPEVQKVFDNLEIISNNAEPESFHYEIIGDLLDFAKDKENMYIRQEATKELYQYNGSDILYDSDWKNIEDERFELEEDTEEYKNNYGVSFSDDTFTASGSYNEDTAVLNSPEEFKDTIAKLEAYNIIKNYQNPKSSILPFIYESRNDTFNEIEDYYKSISTSNKNYDELSGSEIIHDKVTNEYSIWEHQKAINVEDEGRLRGNMQYNRDNWYVQIPPINFILKNECTLDKDGNISNSTWKNGRVPVTIANCPVPSETEIQKMEIPDDLNDKLIDTSSWGALPMLQNKLANSDGTYDYTYTTIDDAETRQQAKVRDKWIKIRIRYTGNKLAIIRKIITTYSQSL